MKYTREIAEKQEIVGLLDALCDGSIELNNDFIEKYCGKEVARVLLKTQESARDRGFYLSSHIDEDKCFFNGTIVENCDNDIWLDVAEIEVQFEGKAEDYFEDVSDWAINGNLAYLYIGYGLTVPVDIKELELEIDDYLKQDQHP